MCWRRSQHSPIPSATLGCCPTFQSYAQSYRALQASFSYIPREPPSFAIGFTFHLVPYLQLVANRPSFHIVPHDPPTSILYQQISPN